MSSSVAKIYNDPFRPWYPPSVTQPTTAKPKPKVKAPKYKSSDERTFVNCAGIKDTGIHTGQTSNSPRFSDADASVQRVIAESPFMSNNQGTVD